MTKKIFLSLMAVLGLLLSAHAQEREITGSVKDHAGAGIVGVTILVEGTTKGTTSGADGSFSIKAAPDNVLVVSFMGYQSHTIKVGTQTRIDVVLKENTQAIDDVIVVAFGTAKKEAAADQHLGTAGRESENPHPRLQLAQRRQRSALDRGRHALLG